MVCYIMVLKIMIRLHLNNCSSHKWIYRYGVECKPAKIEINEDDYDAWRWLRSVGPTGLTFNNPITFEVVNEKEESARGVVESEHHFNQIAAGKWLELDGSL